MMSYTRDSRAIPSRPILGAAVAIASLLAVAGTASAAPDTLFVHGYLTANAGGPVADGGYAMTFLLYNDGAALNPLWSETAQSIKVVGGRFSHVLGAVKPLDPKALLAAKAPELTLKVGDDPELPRSPLHAVAFALQATSATGLDCSGCVGAAQLGKGAVGTEQLAPGAVDAAQVGFTYAGAKTKAGPANVALDLQCTGCVSVSELKIDADLDLGGNALKAKALTAETVTAQTVAATSFVGDGAKLTGIKVPSGACKGPDEVVKGIAADGSLQCAKVISGVVPDSLHEVSSGLLTTQFVQVASGPAQPKPIPDNNPIGLSDELNFPDVGKVKSLKVNVQLSNSDVADVSVELFDPANIKHLLYDKGSKGQSLKGTWPAPDKAVSGDLLAWQGKNAAGKWRLKIIDSKLKDGGTDGELAAWSIEVVTLSNKQVAATGDLLLGGDAAFANKGQFNMLRVQNAAAAPAACDASTEGLLWYHPKERALWFCAAGKFQKLGAWGNDGSSADSPGLSCLDIKTKDADKGDGFYWIKPADKAYEVWCDMTTAGGGWTLVASVHEDNIGAKCNGEDRWSSTKGNSPSLPSGDGTWESESVFGAANAATKSDYKGPAYFELAGKDVAIYHVPNGTDASGYRASAFLRYHTNTAFLTQYGGSLRSLYKNHFPVKFGGACASKGPAIPVVWDVGDNNAIDAQIAPNSVGESTPGYIQFRVFNNEKGAYALCAGIRYDGCNSEHACLGGGGWYPEGNPNQCGDFAAWDWSGYGAHAEWSATKKLTEAAVFILVR